MAIAVFADIHGNLEALEAILKHIKKQRKIKQVYFLGDAVTFGPDSSKCLKLLQKSGVQCVVGNHEQRLIRYDKSVARMTFGGVKHMEYIFHSLDNEDIRYIKSMPLERTLEYKGHKLYFAHYSHDENGIVHEDFDCFREDLLDRMFQRKDFDAVFFGHQHVRKIYIREGHKSFFCLGSSGLTKDEWTRYTYFDIDDNKWDNFDNYNVYLVKLKYDRKKFEQKMREQPIPEKALFAKKFFNLDLENPHAKPHKPAHHHTEQDDD